jgi:hypothetical protein
MNIFRYIADFFINIRSRFRKYTRNETAFRQIKENKDKKLKDVDRRLHDFIEDEEEDSEQIKKVIKEKSAIEIGQELGQEFKEPIFDLADIEEEVNALNQKLFDIKTKKQRIHFIQISSTSKTDESIDRLEKTFQRLNHRNYFLKNFGYSDNWNENTTKADDFFEEFNLVKIHRKRAEKQEREEQVKQVKINELLRQIEQTINSNDNVQLKQNIGIAEKAIGRLKDSKRKTKFKKSLSILIENLRTRKINEEAKRQAAKLKRERKVAEKKREEKEKIIQEKRKKKIKEEEENRNSEELESQSKEKILTTKLQNLLLKKYDWKKFEEVLHKNGITKFYHFTDQLNIESIKKSGGLYSWYHCDITGTNITKSGGDTLSRELDTRYSLQDYVRLSFCNDHPMQFRLSKLDYNLVVLEITLEVAYFEHTKFSDMNATDKRHSHGSSLSDLEAVNFSATKRSYVKTEDPEFKQHQAEILAKTWIPLEYIKNINKF